ncbi:MAG: hypothetical protein AB7I37_00530 [Pirellulales bacterium]
MEADTTLDQNWLAAALDRLAEQPLCGYRAGDRPWTEPTALAALALLAHHRIDDAWPALKWLEYQLDDQHGVGMNIDQREPGWPTGLAVLAWRYAISMQAPAAAEFAPTIERAVRAILSWSGEALEPNEFVAHDCTLVGWSWIDQTHSWVEPTAIQVLALQSLPPQDRAAFAGLAMRRDEAIRLLWDRQLPHGGWNYGNTLVLGQELRPHLLPTGMVLLALAGENDSAARAEASLRYLSRELGAQASPVSLAYGLLALTAHGRRPAAADWWLQVAATRCLRKSPAPLSLSLMALAALSNADCFVSLSVGSQP